MDFGQKSLAMKKAPIITAVVILLLGAFFFTRDTKAFAVLQQGNFEQNIGTVPHSTWAGQTIKTPVTLDITQGFLYFNNVASGTFNYTISIFRISDQALMGSGTGKLLTTNGTGNIASVTFSQVVWLASGSYYLAVQGDSGSPALYGTDENNYTPHANQYADGCYTTWTGSGAISTNCNGDATQARRDVTFGLYNGLQYKLNPADDLSGYSISGAKAYCGATFPTGGFLDLSYNACIIAGYLFIPNTQSIDGLTNIGQFLSFYVPFSYLYELYNIFSGYSTSDGVNFTKVGFTIPLNIGQPATLSFDGLSSSSIGTYIKPSILTLFRNLMIAVIWLTALWTIIHRVKGLIKS